MLCISFSILFASAIDSQSDEEKSIASIPLIQPASAQQSSPGTDGSIPEGTSVPGCQESNECFLPASITIKVGDTVSWTNDDTASHTVTSGTFSAGPDGIFDNSMITRGDTFSVAFDRDGTYPYYCKLHPWQTGYVIVERGDTISPAPSPKSVYGELKVEKENYEVSYSGMTQVKLFGKLSDSTVRGNKITFTITNPEGDREELSVIPSKHGYFENYFLIDRNSLKGIYEVSAFTSEGSFIGKISFQLYDKNNPIVSTAKEPEQASEVAEEKVPDWVKNNAGWWADGLISEDDFLNGIKYLVEKGIIKI